MDEQQLIVHASEQSEQKVNEFMQFFHPFLASLQGDQVEEVLTVIGNTCKVLSKGEDFLDLEEDDGIDNAVSDKPLGSFAVTLDLDEEMCPKETLEAIGRRAFDNLRGAQVSVRINNTLKHKVLSTQDAEAIVQGFFVDMLCSAPARVRQVVLNANLWNAGEAANLAAEDVYAPLALREVYQDIAFLTRSDHATALQFLQRNIKLVQLSEHWADIRRHLVEMGEEGSAIKDHLGLPVPAKGQTYVTLAKAELCKRAGIWPAKFGVYLRDGYIPNGLVKTFGYGSLLLCPTNWGNNRHRFPYPSAAKEVFNIIKRADESGFIEQVCTLLDNALVRSVRQQQPFLFSNNVLAGLEKDSSLLGLIHRLEDGDIEKEDKHMEG